MIIDSHAHISIIRKNESFEQAKQNLLTEIKKIKFQKLSLFQTTYIIHNVPT